MTRVGIIGGAGYTAGELIRILLNHPYAELAYVQSSSNAGNRLCDVHEGIYGETEMTFCEDFPLEDVDVLFLCSGHGKSTEFWSSRKCPSSLKVIDLAQDFRDESCGYVYGLPEINRERLRAAQLVANPGCFATAIQLAVLPLASAGLLKGDVAVTAVTGSTGAGVKPGATTHFSWRNNNLSTYKAFEHQHLKEINMNVLRMQPAFSGSIDFVPMRGDFARGIFASVQIRFDGSQQDAQEIYREFYKDAAFTFLYDGNLDLKQVVNTNKGLVTVEKHGSKLLVNSAIDNLLKGASGQAVQNMNLLLGLDEKAGLKLKASAF